MHVARVCVAWLFFKGPPIGGHLFIIDATVDAILDLVSSFLSGNIRPAMWWWCRVG